MNPDDPRFRELKARHPGMLLLFRIGDCYELYGDDAATAARLLGLPVLYHRLGVWRFVEFPHADIEANLRKLLKAKQRVAVLDQILELPPPGQVVDRVVIPGVVDDVPSRTLWDSLPEER